MRKRVTLLVLLAAGFAQSARAQPTVQMWAAGGGARPAVLPPGDLWVNPTGQLDIYLQIIDEYGQAVPNISMTIGGVGATFSDGGHNHGGGPGCCGSVSPSSGSTGDGSGFKTRYTAGTGAMSVYFYVSFLYGGDTYFIATSNTVRVSEEPNDYTWQDANENLFFLVGSTTSHPSNHYAKPGLNGVVYNFAELYNDRWGLKLALNDSSLVWGGIFDLSNNWGPRHYEHNIGENQDIRANNNLHAIPHDPDVRQWVELYLSALFSSYLHEDPGGTNEHYHVRW